MDDAQRSPRWRCSVHRSAQRRRPRSRSISTRRPRSGVQRACCRVREGERQQGQCQLPGRAQPQSEDQCRHARRRDVARTRSSSTTSSRTARSLPAAWSNTRASATASLSRPARPSPTSARRKPSSRRCSNAKSIGHTKAGTGPFNTTAVPEARHLRPDQGQDHDRRRQAGRRRPCATATSRSASSRPT